MAGVFVDRVDKRHMLLVTNVLRGLAFLAIFLVNGNLPLLYLLMILVSTVTTFFGPAEASMIPFLVPTKQLLAANGLFTLTMNVAFALGFALVGPFLVALASPQALIVIVAALYFVAAAFCWTLPSSRLRGRRPGQRQARPSPTPNAPSRRCSGSSPRASPTSATTAPWAGRSPTWASPARSSASWASSGPGFAETTLALGTKDFVVVVLPLGLGVVPASWSSTRTGDTLPRRRTIEAGMIAMGVLLALLSCAGPISRFLQDNVAAPRPSGGQPRRVGAVPRHGHRLPGRLLLRRSSRSPRRPSFRRSCPRTSAAASSAF